MKHLFFAACFFISASLFAQNDDYKMTVSGQLGINGWQVVSSLIGNNTGFTDENGVSITPEVSATPTFGLSFDYAIANRFSLGLSTGYNSFKFGVNDVDVTRTDGTIANGDIDFSANRFNFAIRPLFHYGKNPKLDMYSGVRLGFGLWSTKVTSDIPNLTEDEAFDTSALPSLSFAPALIPFGMRYYFTDNIGAGFETHLGAPYWFNVQLNARF